MRKIEIPIEMYNYRVIVFKGTKEELEKANKRLKVDRKIIFTSAPGFHVVRNRADKKEKLSIIMMNEDKIEEFNRKNFEYEVLSHELYHAIYRLRNKLGIDDSEAEAYLYSYIFAQAMEILK